MIYSCKLIHENEKKNTNDSKEKSVTASSLANVRVEAWTFHHDFPEKTEAENVREKEEGKCEKVLAEEEKERETLILGRERTNGGR